jgi:putative ABC transport system substrate-binding protein
VFLEKLRVQAGAVGMTVLPAELKPPDALDDVFAALAAKRPDALQIISDSGTLDLGDRIAALALAHWLPSFATQTLFAEFGGLLAYGASRRQLFNKSAEYVRKILQGENPGELPVEQPTRIELWINLKTAKKLGLDIPMNVQQLADQVLE